MKIGVMSDLHLEFDAKAPRAADPSKSPTGGSFYFAPPQPDADVLVLAGDIHVGSQAVDWIAKHFAIPTVLIAGNHEPYGHEIFRVIALNRQKAAETTGRVVFLERATWKWRSPGGERVRFVGATLWTDFQLYRTPDRSMEIAQEQLEDFQAIKLERGYRLRSLLPSDTVRLHDMTANFLERELNKYFAGITVVVTHHAPSPRSIVPRLADDPLNPAFASNLEGLIRTYKPRLWIHGHMHESFDYVVGSTRVVCNPRGYYPDQLNPNFNPNLVIEI